ncbi:MAG TPA: nitronate monooxygenase [Alphaproteobacteria bacterium]|nr:nitronate monooxygenase [Alphaproteobacteria bacterium]
MRIRSDLLSMLGIEHPLILAPMGGGPGSPELVAAVSNAGGLGMLGAAYLSPPQIAAQIGRIRALTDRPFGVNLFAGGYRIENDVDPAAMLTLLADIHAMLGASPPALPKLPPDPFPAQLDAVIDAQVPVFSFTFGIPDNATMARLKARGVVILGTATTAHEARLLADAGVDGIVTQGAEAGAHRGTFAESFEASMVPTLDLVRAAIRTVALPVIASGGLMDGRDIATAMRLGAAATQLGTAFLACPESGASAAYKRAILAAREDTTVITRAYSGRPARGLANTFIARLRGRESTILPYPLQNALTRAMRTAAAERGETGYLSLWAGQGVARARALPAGVLVKHLVEETSEAQRSVSA